ncbi:MAG: ABC transporter ATP-binding protein [Pseudomonadota bacterium]
MTVLLETRGLVKRYGALLVTSDVAMNVRAGEIHAIIGPNGAGKSTLINQLSGELVSDSGTVTFRGQDITAMPVHARARLGVMRSYQITSVFEQFTVRENVALAALGARAHGFTFWRALAADARHQAAVDRALEDTELLAKQDVPVDELGYGERRQLELAMALAAGPKVLLLDEPMAGMSPQESAKVVALLKKLKKSYGIVLIEHDMDAVFALADRITVLVYGKVMLTGTTEQIRNDPQVKAVYLGEETTLAGAAS